MAGLETAPASDGPTRDPMERWKEDYPGTTLGELHKLDPALVEAVLAWSGAQAHARALASSAEIATSDDEDES